MHIASSLAAHRFQSHSLSRLIRDHMSQARSLSSDLIHSARILRVRKAYLTAAARLPPRVPPSVASSGTPSIRLLALVLSFALFSTKYESVFSVPQST